MHNKLKSKLGLAAIGVAAICGGAWMASSVSASDHDESPLVKLNPALDITDLYVFDSAADKTTIIVCWAGFHDMGQQPGMPSANPLFDADALYTIHVDNDGDLDADIQIYWRYGANEQDQFGVQWTGIPGTDGPVEDFTEKVFKAGDFARVWTGHADDPFFFDAGGYLTTVATGTVSFTKADFLAGLNVTAAAIEIDTDLLTAGGNPIHVWATASERP